MSAVHPIDELLKSRSAGDDSTYEAGGPVIVLHRDLEARLNKLAVTGINDLPVGFGERCVRAVSRAAGPVLLLAGYGAIGWAAYALIF